MVRIHAVAGPGPAQLQPKESTEICAEVGTGIKGVPGSCPVGCFCLYDMGGVGCKR